MADEFDLKPTSRGEEFLDVILRSLGGDTPDIPQPAWRYEEYLAAIAKAIQNGGGGSSGGGVLVVHSTYEEWEDNGTWKWKETLDKTATELASADFTVLSNRPVPLETGSWGPAYLCYITVPSELDPNPEWVFAFTNTYKDGDDVKVGWSEFASSSADGYPFAEGVIE